MAEATARAPLRAATLEYAIPITGIKTSTNKIYAGQHWSKRKQLKDSVYSYAVAFCRPVKRIESYPVQISYRFVFRNRPLDTLNTAYMAKMLEDAFRALGILEDDDPAHVASSILEVTVAPRQKGSTVAESPRPQGIEEDDDYVIIKIAPYGR